MADQGPAHRSTRRKTTSAIGWVLVFILIVFSAFMAVWVYAYWRLVGSHVGVAILIGVWAGGALPLWLAMRHWGWQRVKR